MIYPLTNLPVIPDYEALTDEEQDYLDNRFLNPCSKCGGSGEMCKYTVSVTKYFVICSRHDNLGYTSLRLAEAISNWNKENS